MELLLAMAKESAKQLDMEMPIPPAVPPRHSSYKSVFRINGQRILPPLMTTEKRSEMLKFKETAIEREFLKSKQAINRYNGLKDISSDVCEVDEEMKTTQAKVSTPVEATSKTSANKFYDALHGQPNKEAQFCVAISGNGASSVNLKKEGRRYVDASTCTDHPIITAVACKPVQHLQRSDTIIYDNRCNSIIVPKGAVYEMRKRTHTLLTVEEKSRLQQLYEAQDYASQPSNGVCNLLELQRLINNANAKARPKNLNLEVPIQLGIPAICVNPPTPTVDRHETSAKKTQSTVKCESVQTPEPVICDDKLKRSRTSPSLKIGTKAEAQTHNHSVDHSPVTTESILMRSNSFTLERPSKALIEHMERVQMHSGRSSMEQGLKESPTYQQQQQLADVIMQQKQLGNIHAQKPKCIASPTQFKGTRSYASIRRDTVESKAKRVNKIDVKQRTTPARSVTKTKLRVNASPPTNISNTTATNTKANSKSDSAYNLLRRPSVQHVAHAASHTHSHQDLYSVTQSPSAYSKKMYSMYDAILPTVLKRRNSPLQKQYEKAQTQQKELRELRQPHQERELQHVGKRATQKLSTNKTKTTPDPITNRPSPTPHGTLARKQNQNQHQQSKFQSPLVLSATPSPKRPEKLLHAQQQQRQKLSICQQLQVQLGLVGLKQLREQNACELNHTNNNININQIHVAAVPFSPNKVRNQQAVNDIEVAQRKKFMELIAQQHEEQRRLQAQFDMQQKLLLNQICTELSPLMAHSTHSASTSPSIKTLQHSADDHHRTSASEQYTTECDDDDCEDAYSKESTILDRSDNRSQQSLNTLPSSPDSSVSSMIELSEQRLSASSPETARTDTTINTVLTTTSAVTSSPTATTTTNTARTMGSEGSSVSGSPTSVGVNVVVISHDTKPHTPMPTAAEPATKGVTNRTSTGTRSGSGSGSGSGNSGGGTARKRLFNEDAHNNCNDNEAPTAATKSTLEPSDFLVIAERIRERALENTTSSIAMPESRRPTGVDEALRFHAAATIINAHVRGFLVRRLFRTEQIQRIVQTIRDTLIFVINLHLETSCSDSNANADADGDTAVNVRLKARLLQQLCSASRTLHLVFFQTSLKERMEIIARDRKRIKTKILAISLKR